jgi:hypothetical protein
MAQSEDITERIRKAHRDRQREEGKLPIADRQSVETSNIPKSDWIVKPERKTSGS